MSRNFHSNLEKDIMTTQYQKKPRELSPHSRIFANVSLVLAGLKLWVDIAKIPQDSKDRIITITQEYLVKESLIPSITASQLGQKARSKAGIIKRSFCKKSCL